jgi:hypothetical protein
MAYGQDMAGSARRHLAAADLLHNSNRPGHKNGDCAVAGYLFGLAGELALKEIMRESGMRELDSTRRQDDPFYAHFPDIKTLVKDSATGRRHGDLIRYAGNDRLFQFWNISMRYAPTNDIDPRWTGLWKTQAETLVQDMGL